MKLILAGALLLLVAFCFAPLARNGFINYDDDKYVTANPLLEGTVTPNTFRWAFTTFRAANWHPLTWISHQADVALFGFNPRGHHLTSLALHAANTLLLFLLLLRWTGSTWRSAFVSTLFGIHPLHVESVAWVAERKDVLSTLFLFLTLLAYGRYAARSSRANYSAVAILFTLGLLAKPMLVTLPLLLIVLDYWPLGRLGASSRRAPGRSLPAPAALLAEKIPLVALAALSGLMTLAAQTRGGAVKTLEDYPFGIRLANAVVSVVRYLEKTLWPKSLAVFYPHPGGTLSAAAVAAAALLVVAVTLAAVRAAPRRPYALAGWGWYLVTLSPVLGLVQVGYQAMADRYTYIPLTGLFVAAVWTVGDLAKPWRLGREVLAAAAVALVLLLTATTRSQVRVWQNGVSLFEHALAVTDDNYVAHDNLAAELERQGRTREAMRHTLEALRIYPDREPQRYLRFGKALMAEGLLDEAVEVFEKAVIMNPADPSAARLLAAARAAAGRR
jgi:tetratricopeptide (TPR) repeat protein